MGRYRSYNRSRSRSKSRSRSRDRNRNRSRSRSRSKERGSTHRSSKDIGWYHSDSHRDTDQYYSRERNSYHSLHSRDKRDSHGHRNDTDKYRKDKDHRRYVKDKENDGYYERRNKIDKYDCNSRDKNVDDDNDDDDKIRLESKRDYEVKNESDLLKAETSPALFVANSAKPETAASIEDTQALDRQRRLNAWKERKGDTSIGLSSKRTSDNCDMKLVSKDVSESAQKIWMPWEDAALNSVVDDAQVAASKMKENAVLTANPNIFEAAAAAAVAAASLATDPKIENASMLEEELDPLDAFMNQAVLPEVRAREAAEEKKRQEERSKKAEVLASGKTLKLSMPLEDSDSEDEPDLEIQVPTNKVKLVIGSGGCKIQEIQKRSKARVQIKKSEKELMRGFGSGIQADVEAARDAALRKNATAIAATTAAAAAAAASNVKKKGADEGDVGESNKDKFMENFEGLKLPPGYCPPMTTIMIFGDSNAVEIAERMILEAVDNREQKQKQRQKEYDRKREEKHRQRTLFHLRHAHDYEDLELPMGASRADVRKAYRRLALLWHPDKHMHKAPEEAEAAQEKFQMIQKAYDRLTATEEDERVEQIAS